MPYSFRVRVSQEERGSLLGNVAVYNLHVYVVHRAEMTVIAVVDGHYAVVWNVRPSAMRLRSKWETVMIFRHFSEFVVR